MFQKNSLKDILSINRPVVIEIDGLKLSKSMTSSSDGEWTITTELYTIKYGISTPLFYENVDEAIDKVVSLLHW